MLAVSLGTLALWTETDGLRALTAESARRLKVASAPIMVPPTHLESATGETMRFADLAGAIVLVDFIYTRCPTLCVSLGTNFARLQDALRRSERNDVRLLSIQFRSRARCARSIARLRRGLRRCMRLWSLARVTDSAEAKRLLAVFGIVVIQDEAGGLTHNAAIHLVDREGRLARIYDQDDIEAALEGIGAWRED